VSWDAPLEYEVVDVFTTTPFAGNPLAVVLGGDGLETTALQAIAREFALSETAFPMAATTGADYRLRIFTPRSSCPSPATPRSGRPGCWPSAVSWRPARSCSPAAPASCGCTSLRTPDRSP
jgi:hypothetical protein